MSDTPKFEVIDRRKMKKEEEQEPASSQPAASAPAPVSEPEPKSAGPRLVEPEAAKPPKSEAPVEDDLAGELPPMPSPEEMREQESAYEASAQRVEDLLRAQNPTMGAQPPIKFEHLVQQPSRVVVPGRRARCAADGTSRQHHPDAAGRPRPRAPGRALPAI